MARFQKAALNTSHGCGGVQLFLLIDVKITTVTITTVTITTVTSVTITTVTTVFRPRNGQTGGLTTGLLELLRAAKIVTLDTRHVTHDCG